jgi:ribose transport system substrate-binding protein
LNKRFGRLIYGLGVALAASWWGCGGGAPETKVVTRVPIPDNMFKPTDLEMTIGNLITAIGQTEPKTLQLSVVLKALTSYWLPVRTGATRAFGELGVSGIVVAPAQGTVDETIAAQNQMLDDERQEGYQGLGVAPIGGTASVPIDADVTAGIPVITLDSDLATSTRELYVGTINSEAGKTAAGTLMPMLPPSPGTVLLLGQDTEADWPDGFQRTMSAEVALEAQGYTVVIQRSHWDDVGGPMDTVTMTSSLMTSDPPVVGMIGLFSNAFRCGDAAVAASKTSSDIKIVAFDFDPQTVAYMQSGLIEATHIQRQYYMGYLVPYLLYAFNVLGLDKTKAIIAPQMVDDSRFNTGFDVVLGSQLDQYNAFLDSLGISD